MELKKWITNGTFCNYFVISVRTGEKGTMVYHMLLVKSTEGIIIYIIIYIYYQKYLYINMLSYLFIYIFIYIYIIYLNSLFKI